VGAVIKSRHHLVRLLNAVRGAKDKRTMWFELCDELGQNCEVMGPVLQNLESELQQGRLTQHKQQAVETVLDVLSFALSEAADTVCECQKASTATLFFRGEAMKEKFRKVAEKIARCLRNIPLAAFQSTLEMQRDVSSIVKSLETARYVHCLSHACCHVLPSACEVSLYPRVCLAALRGVCRCRCRRLLPPAGSS
jgi:hypothetical protein